MTAVGDKAVAGSGGKFTVEALAAQLVEKKFAAWYLDSQFADVYPHQCQCVRHGASKGTAMRFIKLTDWCGRVEAIPDSANKIDARLSVNDELYKIARLDLDQFSSTFSALFSRSAVCVATPNHSSPPLRCIGCRRLRAADRRGERVAGGALPAAHRFDSLAAGSAKLAQFAGQTFRPNSAVSQASGGSPTADNGGRGAAHFSPPVMDGQSTATEVASALASGSASPRSRSTSQRTWTGEASPSLQALRLRAHSVAGASSSPSASLISSPTAEQTAKKTRRTSTPAGMQRSQR